MKEVLKVSSPLESKWRSLILILLWNTNNAQKGVPKILSDFFLFLWLSLTHLYHPSFFYLLKSTTWNNLKLSLLQCHSLLWCKNILHITTEISSGLLRFSKKWVVGTQGFWSGYLTIVNSTKFRMPSNNPSDGLLQSSWHMEMSIVDYVDLPWDEKNVSTLDGTMS